MILVIIGLILVAFTAIYFTFIYDNIKLRDVLIGPAVGSMILGGSIIFAWLITMLATPSTSEVYEEYKELITYKTVIQNTDNEYVRYDFYEKICDWNEGYEQWEKDRKNPWISWFITDRYKNCSYIDFPLNQGSEPIMSPPTGTP